MNQIREAFGPTALEEVHDVTKYVFPADVREDARLIFKRKAGLPPVVITVADVQAWHNHFTNGADGSAGSIPVAAANPSGLHQRYRVSRLEGRTDPRAVYFVLRLDRFGRDPVHVEACRVAARAYAQAVKGTKLEQVGQDLRQLVLGYCREQPEAVPRNRGFTAGLRTTAARRKKRSIKTDRRKGS